MHIIIGCSESNVRVGDVFDAEVWNPFKEEYTPVITKILRICNQQEYLDFCASHNLPVRHQLLTSTPHYYEIQIMD